MLFSAVCVLFSPDALAAAPAEAGTAAVSSSDSAYFDRVSVIPMNVEVPDFYQQVTTVAGMYIFTTPDGTIHKRIYGSLNGRFGWYIPEGPANVVPVSAEPVDLNEDIEFYRQAVEESAKVAQSESYVGILPPEHGTYGITSVLGIPIESVMFISGAAVLFLCLVIIIVKSVTPKNGRGAQSGAPNAPRSKRNGS